MSLSEEEKNNFSINLTRAMNDRGWVAEDLANKINPPVSDTAVRLWKSGKSVPRDKKLNQIASIFNVERDLFFSNPTDFRIAYDHAERFHYSSSLDHSFLSAEEIKTAYYQLYGTSIFIKTISRDDKSMSPMIEPGDNLTIQMQLNTQEIPNESYVFFTNGTEEHFRQFYRPNGGAIQLLPINMSAYKPLYYSSIEDFESRGYAIIGTVIKLERDLSKK